MKHILLASAAALVLVLPARASQSINLGEIVATAGACKRGEMPADGRMLKIRDYQALFSLLQTHFGGDGRTDFALPDLTHSNATAFAPKGQKVTWCVIVRGDYPPHPDN
jgi:hypothetical protein